MSENRIFFEIQKNCRKIRQIVGNSMFDSPLDPHLQLFLPSMNPTASDEKFMNQIETVKFLLILFTQKFHSHSETQLILIFTSFSLLNFHTFAKSFQIIFR